MIPLPGNKKSAADLIEVDSDDILVYINVLDISVTSVKASHQDRNHNLNKFFGETTSETGIDGKVHKFQKCTCCR